MAASSADRQLLFGLIALQNGLIDQGRLVSAFQAWVRDRDAPLADHLAARGDLDAEARAGVEAMVALHVRRHGGVEESLAAVPAGASTRDRLAALGDPAVEAGLGRLPPGPVMSADDDITASFHVGISTGVGRRFRVLRPHARGGLGAVFVALDSELNREVALKQILDDRAGDAASRQRFLLEAEVTGGLEHPGIVPVYGLGSDADGRPYYAMRFIKGDSLKDAIAQFHRAAGPARSRPGADPAGRPLELRKLLRRFLDVCNAIEYAHSRGVLHRDLKPGNVVVGKHGETLVVDWGLAKPLGRVEPGHEAGERTLVPSSASGSAETLPGSAIGTPAYMSPEQADGDVEKLGSRSDVYSLGATLYCLLTGRPPFQGDDVGAVLDQVRRGEFPPPRRLDPALDPALEAVCLKAMALDPEDRYGSCHALAEDVERWLADEPVTAYAEPFSRRARRWMRRRRTAVTAAAAAVLVAFVGLAGVLAVQTRANARLAESVKRERQRFDLAQEAIRSYTDGVREDETLKNPGLERLRTKLLRRSQDFYLKLEDLLKGQTDARSLSALGSAYSDLGDLTDEVDDKTRALAAHERAREIRQRLAEAFPDVAAYQADLAASHNRIGILASATGRPDDAMAAFERARSIQERLTEAHPGITAYQANLARSHNNIGARLHDSGRSSEAMAAFERARAIWKRLAEVQPAVDEYQDGFAGILNNLGARLRDVGKPAEALTAFEKARETWERLAGANPGLVGYQANLARSHFNIGVLRRDTGKPTEALAAFEKAREAWERLAEANPAVTEYQAELARSHNNVGAMLRVTGEPARAMSAFERAREIRKRLTEAHPDVTAYRSGLAASHLELGLLLRTVGKPAEAMDAFEQARAAQERLAEAHPDNNEDQAELATILNNIGALLRDTGKPAEALPAFKQALAIQERLARSQPDVNGYEASLARSHNNIGVVLSAAGKPAEAMDAFERAREIRQRLTEAHPDLTAYQVDLAGSHFNIGLLLNDTGKSAEAGAAFERALTIQERLAREHPDSPEYASKLGGTLNNLATHDLNAKRFAEARDRLRKAVGWQRKALARSPKHPDYRQSLILHYRNLRRAARSLNDAALVAEAESGLAELAASDPRLQALDARLDAVREGKAPRDVAEVLTLAQRAHDTKRFALAARLWAEAIDSDPKLADDRRKQYPYNAACAAALAASGKGVDQPPPDDAAKGKLRHQALAWLKGELTAWAKLVESGPPEGKAVVAQTLDHWRKDADLAGVRDPDALEKLPEAENAAWRAFWSDVAALRARL